MKATRQHADSSDYSDVFGLSLDWPELDGYGTHTYAPATEIFSQGETADAVYLVRSGLVKLVSTNPDGRESILGLRAQACPRRAAAVTLARPHPFSAVTLDRCRLMRIPADKFLALLKVHSDLLSRILECQCEEQYDGVNTFAYRQTECARLRLARFLSRLVPDNSALPAKKSIRVHLPLKGWEMAQVIG